MDQPITGFHTDAQGDWVAELACGHFQHTRHNPPWTNRPWVTTPEGRSSVLGKTLACRKCDQGAAPDMPVSAPRKAAPEPAPAPTERQEMLSGAPYDANDPDLMAERAATRATLRALNALDPHADAAAYRSTLAALLGTPSDAFITPPFQCDYGRNLRLGRGVYFNFNCVVLDVAEVHIGDHVLIGPNVQIYTAMHPMDAAARRSGVESARPIDIADDVWIGGGAVICPGVRIGARSVIGAGSVVTRDVPPDVFAAGNPCRVVRPLA